MADSVNKERIVRERQVRQQEEELAAKYAMDEDTPQMGKALNDARTPKFEDEPTEAEVEAEYEAWNAAARKAEIGEIRESIVAKRRSLRKAREREEFMRNASSFEQICLFAREQPCCFTLILSVIYLLIVGPLIPILPAPVVNMAVGSCVGAAFLVFIIGLGSVKS